MYELESLWKICRRCEEQKQAGNHSKGWQGAKVQSKESYSEDKQNELEDGGDTFIIHSANERKISLSKPIHIGFKNYQTSKLHLYKT